MSLKYFSKNYPNFNGAGNKAKADIEDILCSMGATNIGFPRTSYSSKVYGFLINLIGVAKAPFAIKKGDVLVLQYPLKKYYTHMCRMAHMRGAKVITLIHDLGSFRRKRLTVRQEIARLNHSDVIVAHTPAMKKWLEENGIKVPVVVLDVFDYLSSTTPPTPSSCAPGEPFLVQYAGNLTAATNGFLYEYPEKSKHSRLSLYGGGTDAGHTPAGADYHGYCPSEQLIASSTEQFGLVWYGPTCSTIDGKLGEYLPYIAPHKLSLAIRCGLPVIVWSKSGMAPFVKTNGIGLCLDTLEQLDRHLESLTPEAMQSMREAVSALSHRLATGYHTRKAITEACKILNNSWT